jgi:tetratricopeptide (TPR) repeat protein
MRMFRRILIFILFISISVFSFAQQTTTDRTNGGVFKPMDTPPPPQTVAKSSRSYSPPVTDAYSMAYDLAMQNEDYPTAITIEYFRLAMDTSNPGIKDTLAALYFAQGRFDKAEILGNQVLAREPYNLKTHLLVAYSEQQTGDYADALDHMQTIYSQTKNTSDLYGIAQLQFLLQRFGECNQSLDNIIAAHDSRAQVVTMNDPGGKTEIVHIIAAAYYMKGEIAKQMNQTNDAQKYFQQALLFNPDFQLAQTEINNFNSPKNSTPKKNK